jgi:hypothetical protein
MIDISDESIGKQIMFPMSEGIVGKEVESIGSPDTIPEGVKPLDIDPLLFNPHGMLNRESVLPGYNGVPHRGPVPDLKAFDAEKNLPQYGVEVRVDILELNKKEDLKRYNEIMQVVGNGFADISAEERVYDPEIKNWRIFLRWGVSFTHTKK